MKFTVAVPLVVSLVSFVLTILALLAGHQKGFMEDYHVVMFNTSTLGQNYLSSLAKGGSSTTASATTTATATSTTSKGALGGIGGLFTSIEASATAVVGSIESSAASILNDVGNDVADKLSKELGIEQFYSIHVLDLCQGNYAPNATAENAHVNITSCTKPGSTTAMDISTLLNKQLSVGPFNVSLSDLGFTSKLEDKLGKLPSIFEALAALYIVSAIFTGLSMLGAAAALILLPNHGRILVISNLVCSGLGFLFLLIGSLMYTIGAAEIVKKIHSENAKDIGLSVSIGQKFEGLTWAAFALITIAAAYWVWLLIDDIRLRKRMRGTKNGHAKHSMESSSPDRMARNY
ncbi:actin cortical patch SUR7/pH-response regulator pali [Coniella lustricola]|uniref:Actin cortical patch SUR7/pH-response regulator pali n=1 Tax=Coniella lustricola TaxID=2025994 RepID=A0A2T3A467_9PEZI|nr:actin cortical patch SUR7/pH-response regulator pali [Coniella lustricola]